MQLEIYYQLKHEPGQLPETLRLRHREWTVLLSLDGNQSVRQTLKRFGMEESELEQMLEKFRKEDLIEDAEINYASFVSRQEALKKKEEQQRAAAPATATPEVRSVPQFTPLPMPTVPVVAPVKAPVAVPVTQAAMTEAASADGRKLNLKAMIDFIIRHSGGDPNAGQLAVYRVFMRVDTKLLRRNGINSLRFQDDRIVSDPELEQALAESVESALGTRIPESVFAGN